MVTASSFVNFCLVMMLTPFGFPDNTWICYHVKLKKKLISLQNSIGFRFDFGYQFTHVLDAVDIPLVDPGGTFNLVPALNMLLLTVIRSMCWSIDTNFTQFITQRFSNRSLNKLNLRNKHQSQKLLGGTLCTDFSMHLSFAFIRQLRVEPVPYSLFMSEYLIESLVYICIIPWNRVCSWINTEFAE